MKKPRTGKFFNHHVKRHHFEGVTHSVREELELEGYEVYWGFENVPSNLVSASKAKRTKAQIDPESAAYVEDAWHNITTLYRITGGENG